MCVQSRHPKKYISVMANKKIAKQNIAVVVVGGNAVLKMFITSPEKNQQQHYRKLLLLPLMGTVPEGSSQKGKRFDSANWSISVRHIRYLYFLQVHFWRFISITTTRQTEDTSTHIKKLSGADT